MTDATDDNPIRGGSANLVDGSSRAAGVAPSDEPTVSRSKRLGHALGICLQRHGVDTIFSQCFPVLLQHVAPEYGIRQVGFRTENSGGAMADGYARVSGRIGVIGAQGGPGATLLVPPLAEAQAASVPLLAIVEENPRRDADRNGFQELDHPKLFAGCAKWVRRLASGARLNDYVDLAITAATSGRPGPAVLVLPSDLFEEEVLPSARPRSMALGRYPLDRSVPEPSAIKEAVRWIVNSKRPILIAGGGVHLSGAAEAVCRLCERAAIPVASTYMGKGVVDERSELSLGVFGNTMGAGSSAGALRKFASDADLVILVGSRTNANGTDYWSIFPPAARYIHIDVDGLEVGRNYEALRLVGDAKATVEGLLEELISRDTGDLTARREYIRSATCRAREIRMQHLKQIGRGLKGAIRPEHVITVLDQYLGGEDILCADASCSTNWVAAFATAKAVGARFLTPRGLAGLGWGLPLALGAQAAEPNSKVFAVVGDGGFAHCWSELETARRMRLNVVVIVLNNQILGLQLHGEDQLFGKHSDAAELGPVDHAAIARACDCYGERVVDPGEFEAALNRAISSGKPALLDVVTDADATPPVTLFEKRLSGISAV